MNKIKNINIVHMMDMKLAARGAVAAALFGTALATTGLVTTPARADTQIGLLRCSSAEPTSYLVVSNQPLNCVFTPSSAACRTISPPSA